MKGCSAAKGATGVSGRSEMTMETFALRFHEAISISLYSLME